MQCRGLRGWEPGNFTGGGRGGGGSGIPKVGGGGGGRKTYLGQKGGNHNKGREH